jgi:heme-degrading monooxygenase HmoA
VKGVDKYAELYEHVKFAQQWEEDGGPVILINIFHVKPEHGDKSIEAWAADAAYFKQQPGYISTQLHKGIGGSGTFLNYAVWESKKYKEAFNKYTSSEVQSKLLKYPDSASMSPHLFKKVAVTDICTT